MRPLRKAKKGAFANGDVSDRKVWACPLCRSSFKTKGGLSDHTSAKHADPQAPKIIRAPTCMECGSQASLVGGEELYPHRPDLYAKWFYKCACGAYCGCHPGTKHPLGNPAGPKTRAARKRAHNVFDPIWRQRDIYGLTRPQAYALMAEALHIPAPDCHIGMMNAETADRAQRWAYQWRGEFHGKKV